MKTILVALLTLVIVPFAYAEGKEKEKEKEKIRMDVEFEYDAQKGTLCVFIRGTDVTVTVKDHKFEGVSEFNTVYVLEGVKKFYVHSCSGPDDQDVGVKISAKKEDNVTRITLRSHQRVDLNQSFKNR